MFQRVMAAIDGSPASFHAAIVGAQLVARDVGTIQLVCVIEGLRELESRLTTVEDHDALHRRCEVELSSAQAAIGSLATVRERKILLGKTAESILDFAEESRAELLCVGSGRHKLKLGSISATMVRKARIPVVVVPAGVSTGPRLRRILLGFDGSECARGAARRLGSIAAATNAEVRIDFVLEPPWPLPEEGLDLPPDEIAKMAGIARGADLDEARELIEAEGGRVAALGFDLGDPADRLMARADSWNADLIVVGARGQSPARRFILGGISDKLASRSERPVLIFR